MLRAPHQTLAHTLVGVSAVGLLANIACTTPEPPAPVEEPEILEPEPEPEPEPPPPPPVTIDLRVSPALQALFVPITKDSYGEDELPALFDQMRELGDAFCSMKHGLDEVDLAAARAFIAPEFVNVYLNAYKSARRSIESGCWNFFLMNDQHPYRDFELVGALFPSESYDCYSVGFAQPYMMHNVLGCSSLTMIDIDWRVLDAHHRLLTAYDDELVETEGLETAIGQVQVSWIAWTGQMRPSYPATVKSFCSTKQFDTCQGHLEDFQGNWDDVKKLQLSLASLDGTHFFQTEVPKVFYLSNAIESMYTTRKEFDTLMESLGGALEVGQHAYLIHHVGGYPNYGIYDLSCTEDGCGVETVCRDVYVATAIGATEPTYDTYFETVTKTKGAAPSCRSLWKKHVETPAEPEAPADPVPVEGEH